MSASLGRSSRLVVSGLPRSPATEFCLEINANTPAPSPDPGISVRRIGAAVDIWQCDKVETFADYADRDKIDHWWLHSTPAHIRSIVADTCVAFVGSLHTAACSASDPAQSWQLLHGRLSTTDGQCLVPDWSTPQSGSSSDFGFGYPLTLAPCSSGSARWKQRANSLVVYPAPDPAWASDAHNYAVSVESAAGGTRHRLFTYLSAPWEDAPTGSGNCLASPPCCYARSSGAWSCDRATRGSQYNRTVSWASFSFDGTALAAGVRVTVVPAKPFTECRITPVKLGIHCDVSRDGASASFTIASPMTKVSIEFDPAKVRN